MEMLSLDNVTGIFKCSACGELYDLEPELREHEKECLRHSIPAPSPQMNSLPAATRSIV